MFVVGGGSYIEYLHLQDYSKVADALARQARPLTRLAEPGLVQNHHVRLDRPGHAAPVPAAAAGAGRGRIDIRRRRRRRAAVGGPLALALAGKGPSRLYATGYLARWHSRRRARVWFYCLCLVWARGPPLRTAARESGEGKRAARGP